MALLLINPQEEDPFVEAGGKSLETTANRQVPRLLVFSQIDVDGMKIGNAKIDRLGEQHRFAGWLGGLPKSSGGTVP